jgi:hypothetical protein
MIQLFFENTKGQLALIGMFIVVVLIAVHGLWPLMVKIFGKKKVPELRIKVTSDQADSYNRKFLFTGRQLISNKNVVTEVEGQYSKIRFKRIDPNHVIITFIDCNNKERKVEQTINPGLFVIGEEFLYVFARFNDPMNGKDIEIETTFNEIK